MKHFPLLQMLKSCKKLSMTVRSPSLPAGPISGGAPWQMRQTCSWMDRQGRPVSPPIEYIRSSQMAPPERYAYSRPSSKDRSIRRVNALHVWDLWFRWGRQMHTYRSFISRISILCRGFDCASLKALKVHKNCKIISYKN